MQLTLSAVLYIYLLFYLQINVQNIFTDFDFSKYLSKMLLVHFVNLFI